MSRRTIASSTTAIVAALAVGASLLTLVVGGPLPARQPSSSSEARATSLGLGPVPTTIASPGLSTSPTTHPGVVLGAFIPDVSSDPSKIDTYAGLTGTTPHIVEFYEQWAGDDNAFYRGVADAIRARGAMPLVSWAPWAGQKVDPEWTLSSIIDGSHDAYVHQWTRDVATWGFPLYVIPMSEMNGHWYPWSPGVNGSTADQFVSAWRHIVDIARTELATNVRWVWCPNIDPLVRYTPFASLYPGDDYVDWTCLDGYNWGDSQSWSSWVEMYSLFEGSVEKIAELSDKPMMIAEIGTSELGGDKAAWIRDGFRHLLLDLPQVRAVVWFSANKETDWRVNSSPESLAAFRAIATSEAFAGTLP